MRPASRPPAVRFWVAAVLVAVAAPVSGLGPEAWPFVRWAMFAGPGPATTDAVTVVGERPGADEVVYDEPVLPGGFVRELYEPRLDRLDAAGVAADCARMLDDVRDDGVIAVRVESWTWAPLDREPDDASEPAGVTREVLTRCG